MHWYVKPALAVKYRPLQRAFTAEIVSEDPGIKCSNLFIWPLLLCPVTGKADVAVNENVSNWIRKEDSDGAVVAGGICWWDVPIVFLITGSAACEMDGSRSLVWPGLHSPERCVSKPTLKKKYNREINTYSILQTKVLLSMTRAHSLLECLGMQKYRNWFQAASSRTWFYFAVIWLLSSESL